MRDAIIRDIDTDTAHVTVPHGQLLVVSPDQLPVESIGNDKQKLIETFDAGFNDALALKDELRELFA